MTFKRFSQLAFGQLCLWSWLFAGFIQAQSQREIITNFLSQRADDYAWTAQDVAQWAITDQYTSAHNGVTHVHIRQQHQGIAVYNGSANLAIKHGQVVHFTSRLQANLAQRAQATEPLLTAEQAIVAAAQALGLEAPRGLRVIEQSASQQATFSKGGISQVDIPVQLMYQPGPEGELFLSWDLSIYPLDGEHWWSVRVDALTGELRDQSDWVLHCAFPEHAPEPHTHAPALDATTGRQLNSAVGGGEYRVFARLIESPNHGARTLEVDPADSLASPYGWHDDNGLAGAEYTITRGNNVYATEDRGNNNLPGYAPDGGAALIFDFPYQPSLGPVANEDAAITNLFYYNNIMHDVWYHYGFDEPSGNFQQNNYGRGGVGSDYVNADAQDGSGTNNANFATPPEGNNPRMQMYIWTGGGGNSTLTINSPGTIAGNYGIVEAAFGPGLTAPITADLALVDDGTGDAEDACDPLVNAAAISGKIAVIDRGNCTFVEKVLEVQNAGAVAAIVVNNTAGGAITMGPSAGSGNVTIPSVMISLNNGNPIKAQLSNGTTVNGTLSGGVNNDRDSDFDNGIIAHEYTHGISIRLTGGPSSSGCLSNAEQMGEGWSDYFGLMTSFDPNVTARGIGTYAIDEPTNGVGIRNARYSPNFSINNYTYGDVNNAGLLSRPHGVGFVWCTMLWDLTLALVDEYGYDPDIIDGNGGNNLAMQLVMDGLKLQPCGPGFVDGRDAILKADTLLTGGVNGCLIWEVFARRGLGLSADQGSPNSRSDQTEAFDIPNLCKTPLVAPTAAFLAQVGGQCGDQVTFTDQSSDIPQAYLWFFGDGDSAETINPTHTYLASGTYSVTLIVSNTLGSDTVVQPVTITLPTAPTVNVPLVCAGSNAQLVPLNVGDYLWYDAQGNFLDTTYAYLTAPLTADTQFQVSQILPAPVQSLGPPSPGFGAGGYHNTGFTGTLNFTAETEFTLISAWVDAGSPGTRTIFLWDAPDGNGNVVDQVTVSIPAGPQRITLDLAIPGPGTYSVGGTTIDLYRNSSGANYPYEIAGLASIYNSSATTGAEDFYYYLYDWEVQAKPCVSDLQQVFVDITEAEFSATQDSTTATFDFTDLSQGAMTWSWDFGDGNTSNLPNPTHSYDSAGTYVVTLVVNGGCSHSDTVEAFLVNTGASRLARDLSLTLSPNPAQEQATLSLSRPLSEPLRLLLLDARGRVVQTNTLPAGIQRQPLDLSDLSAGVYSLRVQSSQGRETLRLMKN
jgi:PKD repeat protein